MEAATLQQSRNWQQQIATGKKQLHSSKQSKTRNHAVRHNLINDLEVKKFPVFSCYIYTCYTLRGLFRNNSHSTRSTRSVDARSIFPHG